MEEPKGSLKEHRSFKRRGKVKSFTQESKAQIKFDETLKVIDWANPEYEPIEVTTSITTNLAA
jgi:hypothetical protein